MKFFICLLAALLAVANAGFLRGGYISGGSYPVAFEKVVRVVEPAPVVHYAPAPVVHHHVQHIQPVQVVKVIEQPAIHRVSYVPAPATSYVKYVNVHSAPLYSGAWKKK